MTLSPMASWTLAVVVGGSVLVATSWGYQNAAKADAFAARRLQRVTEQSEEYRRLSAALPAWTRSGTDARSGDALAQRVSAAIAAAGLPASALASLSPESQAGNDGGSRTVGGAGGGVKIERRRAVLTLGSITLPQLGRLLAAWREREPEWTVTSIDATPLQISDKPERGGGAGGGGGGGVQVAPGGDIPARVVIAIERWSVRQPPKAVPAPSASPLVRPSSSPPRKPPNTSPPPAGGSR